MNTARIKWKDKNRLDRLLSKKKSTMLDKSAVKAMKTAGLYVIKEIQKRMPEDKGNLKNAIERGAVIITESIVAIKVYATGKSGTAIYNKKMEKGPYGLGPKSEAKNKSGEVGPGAWKRTFADKKVEDQAFNIIKKIVFEGFGK